MPFDGLGVFTPAASSVVPALSGTIIDETDFNALVTELSAALTKAVLKDGQSTTSAVVTFAVGIRVNNTGLQVLDTNASHYLSITPGSNLTADRIFTLTTGDAARTLDMSLGNISGVMNPSDGVLRVSNAAGTDFSRLQFGGTTSSFPALKRSSATLQVRLADDSGAAGLDAYYVALSGGQISFPAAQNASADANTLDDYEEGTWTATLGDGTNNYTISSQTTTYTKVGRQVYVRTSLTWSSIGSAGAGQLRIGGLPFAAGSGSHAAYIGSITGFDFTATLNPITAYVNASSIFFERVNDNAAPTVLPSNGSSATGNFVLSAVYEV